MIIQLGHLSDWIEVDGLRVADGREVKLTQDGTAVCWNTARQGKRPPPRRRIPAHPGAHCTRLSAVDADLKHGFSSWKARETSAVDQCELVPEVARRSVSRLGWSFSHVDATGSPQLQLWKVEITEKQSGDGRDRSYTFEYHPLQLLRAKGLAPPGLKSRMEAAASLGLSVQEPTSNNKEDALSDTPTGATLVDELPTYADARDDSSPLTSTEPPAAMDRWKMEAAKWVLESSTTDAGAKEAANQWIKQLFQSR